MIQSFQSACDRAAPTDEELAVRAQLGCRDSFAELAGRYQVRLLRFLQRRVRAADAEDLVQETFIRAFERLNQYDSRRAFGTWLFTIGHRLAVSHHRRAQAAVRAGEVVADQIRSRGEIEAHSSVIEEESRKHFWNLAATVLSDEQMCAVWLFYVEQMPAPQIAEVLGRSWVSVKTTLFRARRKLEPVVADLVGWKEEKLPVAKAALVS